MHDAVRADALTGTVGEQAVGEPALDVAARQRPCSARRRAPPAPPATADSCRIRRLNATRSTPKSAPSARNSSGASTHRVGRDQEVALRQRRQLVGVPVALGRRSRFGRGRHRVPCSHACRPSPTSPPPRSSSTRLALTHNLDTMTAALPGARLRPHVKAHKCTALAREQARRGHTHFTAATPREIVGLAHARARRRPPARERDASTRRGSGRSPIARARVTVAVDSEATVEPRPRPTASARCSST